MAVAFPTSIGNKLARSSVISQDTYTLLDVMDDGEQHVRVIGDAPRTAVRCTFKYLSGADFATLRTFYNANRAETVTWTIDGVDYSGNFSGGWRHSKEGKTYNVAFNYRAVEV